MAAKAPKDEGTVLILGVKPTVLERFDLINLDLMALNHDLCSPFMAPPLGDQFRAHCKGP